MNDGTRKMEIVKAPMEMSRKMFIDFSMYEYFSTVNIRIRYLWTYPIAVYFEVKRSDMVSSDESIKNSRIFQRSF